MTFVSTFFIFAPCLYCEDKSNNDPDLELRFKLAQNGTAFLPIEVFDEKLPFVLDTGASQTVLDSDLHARLGPVVEERKTQTLSGVQSIEFFAAPLLRIGIDAQLDFRSNQSVGCVDFGALKESLDVDSVGVLGMDFMGSRVVRLNFDERFGEVRRHFALESTHLERLRFLKGVAFVMARIPSEGFKSFEIDTGADGASLGLERDLFNRMMQTRKLVLSGAGSTAGVNRVVAVRHGIIECLEFGPHRFFNVTVSEGPLNSFKLPFLRRFDCEFDFPDKVARFRPGGRINDPDRRNRAGLGVKRVNRKTMAMILDPSGPSGLSGLRDNDWIQRVNGMDAAKMPLTSIRELLRTPGASLRIAFERDGVQWEVALTLSNDPDPFPAKSPHELIEEKTFDFDK